MLILDRKLGEQVLIAGNIVITVKKCNDRRVSLGIEAPTEVPIRRPEQKPRLGTEPDPSPDPTPAI